MKTSTVEGEQFPPLWQDVLASNANYSMDLPRDLQMTCPAVLNSSCTSYSTPGQSAGLAPPEFFAIGSPRFNVHIGHLVWTTMFLRLHNSVCDILAEDDPFITDERVRIILPSGRLQCSCHALNCGYTTESVLQICTDVADAIDNHSSLLQH